MGKISLEDGRKRQEKSQQTKNWLNSGQLKGGFDSLNSPQTWRTVKLYQNGTKMMKYKFSGTAIFSPPKSDKGSKQSSNANTK